MMIRNYTSNLAQHKKKFILGSAFTQNVMQEQLNVLQEFLLPAEREKLKQKDAVDVRLRWLSVLQRSIPHIQKTIIASIKNNQTIKETRIAERVIAEQIGLLQADVQDTLSAIKWLENEIVNEGSYLFQPIETWQEEFILRVCQLEAFLKQANAALLLRYPGLWLEGSTVVQFADPITIKQPVRLTMMPSPLKGILKDTKVREKEAAQTVLTSSVNTFKVRK